MKLSLVCSMSIALAVLVTGCGSNDAEVVGYDASAQAEIDAMESEGEQSEVAGEDPGTNWRALEAGNNP